MPVNRPSRATRLILLAHAETPATRAGAFPGDDELTAAGRDAVQRCRAVLAPFGAAWMSPAPAARETAGLLGVAATPEAGLADLNCGRWRGRAIQAIAASEPEAAAAWRDDPTWCGHGGEALAALVVRITSWLDGCRQDGTSGLAITHAAVVRAAVLAVVEAPARAFWTIDAAPLTRAVLTSDGKRWALRGLLASDAT